jgi:hypothetical protein
MSLAVELNRIAATEAVSIDTSLALVAKHRGELELKALREKLDTPEAEPAPSQPLPPEGTGLSIDKTA